MFISILMLIVTIVFGVYVFNLNKDKHKVIVAVLDSGIDYNQYRFKKFITKGYNIFDSTSIAQDDLGHGTEISSIITEFEPNLKIMPIKFISKAGIAEKQDLIKAIYLAVNNGANILNISSGVISPSLELEKAIEYAEMKNVLVVSSTGNDSYNDKIRYPAAFSTVLAVGSVDENNKKLNSSNSGRKIDVVALGDNIDVTSINSRKKTVSGTSASCAIVTALATRILIDKPLLSAQKIRKIICQMALDIDNNGWDQNTGYGIVKYERHINYENIKKLINNYLVTEDIPFEKSFSDNFNVLSKNYFSVDYDVTLTVNFQSLDDEKYHVKICKEQDGKIIVNYSGTLDKISLTSDIKRGRHYIEIEALNHTNPHCINLSLQLRMPNDNYEQNDSMKNAIKININSIIKGNFHTIDDVDWYYFLNNEKFENIIIEVNSDSTDIDPVILIKDNKNIKEIDKEPALRSEKIILNTEPESIYFLCIKNSIKLEAEGEYTLSISRKFRN